MRWPRRLPYEHGLPADEPAWFVEGDGEAKARLETIIGYCDVMAVVPIALFHSQAATAPSTRHGECRPALTGRHQSVVHVTACPAGTYNS